jgi:hypothetical protein
MRFDATNKLERKQALGMLRADLSIQNNANHFNCHHNTFVRLLHVLHVVRDCKC